MFKSISLISLSLLTTQAFAATQEEIDAAARAADVISGQEQQRLSAQESLLEPEKQPSGVDLTPQQFDVQALKDADGNCIALEQIKVRGAVVMDEWDLEVLEAPFLGKCIDPALASSVLASATDYYLSRGFITSRAYLPNQNLKDGVMDLFIAEGAVEEVVTKGQKPIKVATAYEQDVDLGLNIRDLEQAVDQLNAVPGNNVKMSIEPGQLAQTSKVVFENSGKPGVTGRLSTDNTGSESTGQRGASLSIQAGDILGLNEVWSLSARESLGSTEKQSHSYSASLKIPHGYNTYSFGMTKGGFNTLLTFPTTGTQITSEGANESKYASASRVLFRDQDSKHSVSLTFKRDSVESYLADTKIDVNTRSLNSLSLSGESVLGIEKSVLVVTPEIAMGLSEVDNLPDGVNTPLENPQAEYLRYKLTLDWSQPFQLNQTNMRWKSRLVSQYADSSLYGSQQIIVGGASSVRGSHDISIVGDRGYYLQNTLSAFAEHSLGKYPMNAEYFVGYDFGEVWSERPDVYEGDMGAYVVGANLSLSPWTLSITHSIPEHVSGDKDKGDAFTSATLGLDF